MDRIYEAYEGRLSENMFYKSHERIDWICENSIGPKVLDIGCSQGICPILLARNGIHSLGIDISRETIDFALEMISRESEDVQKRVQFLCDDFLHYTIPNEKFDTVILTEILEHVARPDMFVKKAAACLREGGTAVITVPFGINDHPDHIHTYYFAEVFKLLNSEFTVTDARFFGNWIGFTALHFAPEGRKSLTVNEDILCLVENEFYKLERELRDKLKKTKERMDTITTEFNKANQEKEILKDNAEANAQAIRTLKNRISVLENDKVDLERQNNVFQSEIEAQKESYKIQLATQKEQLEAKLQKYSAEIQQNVQKFEILAASPLGRRQIQRWKRRHNILVKEDYTPNPFREFLKKFPFLVRYVNKLREKEANYVLIWKKNNNIIGSNWNKSVQPAKSSLGNTLKLSKAEIYAKKTDIAYYDRIKSMVAQIPDSNGGRYYHISKMKIGFIADEFLYDAYKGSAEFVYLRPDDYVQDIDILLVVSAWRGVDKAWVGLGNPKCEDIRNRLFEIIDYYRMHGKKVLFYSKEDPGNYAVFLPIALRCDYIFTTEVSCIDDYKSEAKHDRVWLLPLCVNPQFHNPIGFRKYNLDEEVFFAGTWWNWKYPERAIDTELIFEGVLQGGKKLRLIDRNYDNPSDHYMFPEQYLKYVSPSIPHDVLQKIHKLYTWSVNINSAKYSESMFANRVYELQALGSLIISNYNVGMRKVFPQIFVAQFSVDVARLLNRYNEEEIYQLQVEGIRRVMTGETCYDRLAYILECIGEQTESLMRKVAVVVDDPACLELQTAFEAQSYPHKILVSTTDMTEEIWSSCDAVAYWSRCYEYGPYYIEDMMNGFKYTACDFITKDAFYEGRKLHGGVEHDYIDHYADKYRTVFWTETCTMGDVESCQLANGYCIDRFNINKLSDEDEVQ